MLSDYVSVIVSTRDPLQERTQAAIQHLQHSTQPYELILLNRNHSWTTGTIANQGIHASIGEYIMFLCDDCFIEPQTLEAMVEVLQDKEVGVVGALLRYPNGKVQHAGGSVSTQPMGGNQMQILLEHNSQFDEVYGDVEGKDFDFVTGACMMTRRNVIEDIGGYDPACKLTWGDVDFCFRARRGGYRIRVAASAKGVHQEGTTRRELHTQEQEMESMQWFLRKWGESEFVLVPEEGVKTLFHIGEPQ